MKVGFDADDEGKKTIATRSSEWGFTDEKMIWVVVLLLLLFLRLDCRLRFFSSPVRFAMSMLSHASAASNTHKPDRFLYMYIFDHLAYCDIQQNIITGFETELCVWVATSGGGWIMVCVLFFFLSLSLFFSFRTENIG